MSLKNIDTSEKNVALLEIDIEKSIFDEAVTKIFRKNAPNMTVPGFRKGKAPRNIIEKMYGKGLFYEDALNELIPAAVDEAVEESKIQTVSRPEIDVKSIDENGVLFTAKMYTKPEVELRRYKELEAEKIIIKVEEKDIDAEIEKARKRNSRSIQITDRAAQEGDDTVIDFEGFLNGIPFEGGKGTNHTLKLGSGQFIPGFEEQIVGKNVGESFDVNVTFPEEYQSEELAGESAVFKVTLHEIKFEELPEVDDEFVKDVSEFDTVDEYRASIRTTLEKAADGRAETAVEEQIADGLIANLEADIPAVMIESETDSQLQDYAYRLQQQGIDMDLYMKYTGMDINKMREQFKLTAERQVRLGLALEKIVAIEKIEASEEDLSAEFEKIAKAYSMEIDDVKEKVNTDVIKEDIAMRKAIDLVKENAIITTVEKTAEEVRQENEQKHKHEHEHEHEHSGDCDCEVPLHDNHENESENGEDKE